ncbi:hypothetical protein Hrubri_4365 [Herbaspirillum rubrisubalbicans M1]|uniref:hypothetical protein n=1 Tax=Herbaspirillum rubrisubalbicans TaxID=80842 RepID=UPI00073A185E|nr:hypothetical protein [Herbaspirillum rubrisubalbicans]ALU91510.1 hypothetical protein Hrubri_4365 [Herbaspirillum rubrisubalbicans M1]
MVANINYEAYQISRIADEYTALGFSVFIEITVEKVAEMLEQYADIPKSVVRAQTTISNQFRFDVVALRREERGDANRNSNELTQFVIVEVLNRANSEALLLQKKKIFEGLASVAPFIEVDFRYIEKDELPLLQTFENRVIFSIRDVLGIRLSKFEKGLANSTKQLLEDWGLYAMTVRCFCEHLSLDGTKLRPPLDLYNELLAKKMLVPAEDADPDKVTHSLFDVYECVQAAMLGVVLNPQAAVQMRAHLESLRTQVRKYIRPKHRYT